MTRIDAEQLRKLWDEGVPRKEIARRLGVTAYQITKHEAVLGLPRREGMKATAAQEAKIVRLYTDGLSMMRVGIEVGVSHATVHRVLAKSGLSRGNGITGQTRRYGPRKPKEAQEAPPEPATLDERLIATKGRWSVLSRIAAQQGWSSTRAQQEYHRARARTQAMVLARERAQA